MRTATHASEPVELMTLPSFRETIVKRSVKDQVGNKLAAMIASGILRVGDALPGERDLAAALAVSRETIRGAIQSLAARGILEVSHGARTRVVTPNVGAVTIGFATAHAIDAYDVESVHATRLLVEGEVVGAAARLIDDGTLCELEKLLKAQEGAVDDPVRFLISDREFHVTIYRASGNALLADFATDLYSYVMDRRRLVISRPGAMAASYGDHLTILEALANRDAATAVNAFATHAKRIYETTRSTLEPRVAAP